MLNCVSAPAGVGPSGTDVAPLPAPVLRPPQVSPTSCVPPEPPLFTVPQLPPGGPVMKLSTVGLTGMVVVVVVVGGGGQVWPVGNGVQMIVSLSLSLRAGVPAVLSFFTEALRLIEPLRS